MCTGPPPEPPTVSPIITPSVSDLVAAIFISHATSELHREWRLVRVVFCDSVLLRPSCLQDGRFLVEFFVRHTADGRYNSANQQFWLQYHMPGDIASPLDTTNTHLIRPSDTSEQTAAHKGLVAFCQWVNLTHDSVFLHGPFEFASIHGCKSRDCVSINDWTAPDGLKSQYDNPAPTFDMPSYTLSILTVVSTASSIVLPSAPNSTPLLCYRRLLETACISILGHDRSRTLRFIFPSHNCM
jgi:hypothetical protein